MMRSMKMMWTGGVMLIVGWLIIFAVILGLLPETFFVNFFGYAVSFTGLLVGLVGVLDHVRPGRD